MEQKEQEVTAKYERLMQPPNYEVLAKLEKRIEIMHKMPAKFNELLSKQKTSEDRSILKGGDELTRKVESTIKPRGTTREVKRVKLSVNDDPGR